MEISIICLFACMFIYVHTYKYTYSGVSYNKLYTLNFEIKMNESMPGLFNILSVEKEASFPAAISHFCWQIRYNSFLSRANHSPHPENIHISLYTYVCHDLKNRFWIFVSSTEPIFSCWLSLEQSGSELVGRALEITTEVSML